MKDEFHFRLDMSKPKDRISLRKLMSQIVKEVMANGNYLSDIIVDKDIDEIPLWGENEKKVIIGHLVRGADILLRFQYTDGRKRGVSSEGN